MKALGRVESGVQQGWEPRQADAGVCLQESQLVRSRVLQAGGRASLPSSGSQVDGAVKVFMGFPV